MTVYLDSLDVPDTDAPPLPVDPWADLYGSSARRDALVAVTARLDAPVTIPDAVGAVSPDGGQVVVSRELYEAVFKPAGWLDTKTVWR